MILLPVLDLLNGRVVHACRGHRDGYLPLAAFPFDSSPLSVTGKLLELYQFQQLYIADLDAIMGRGNNHLAIAAIAQCYPALQLWVDGGIADSKAIERLLEIGVTRPVVGTETLPGLKSWQALQNSPWAERLVLSLDYREGKFLGPPGLERQPELWPTTLIAMNLDQIGGKEGPHWPLLARLRQRCLQRDGELLAAGGIRGLEDLNRLTAEGIKGALLATALYDGSLGAAQLRQTPSGSRPLLLEGTTASCSGLRSP